MTRHQVRHCCKLFLLTLPVLRQNYHHANRIQRRQFRYRFLRRGVEIRFYDDSKATNPAAAACALTAFSPGSIHLVLGGRDKGADWTELIREISTRACAVWLVGDLPAMRPQHGLSQGLGHGAMPSLCRPASGSSGLSG